MGIALLVIGLLAFLLVYGIVLLIKSRRDRKG